MRHDCSLWRKRRPNAALSASSSACSPGVPERRVARVVPETDRLDEILVEPERTRDDARDRGRLERVGHPGAVVVAFRVDEDLRLSLQPPERLRVDEAITVALERRADAARRLGLRPAPRLERAHGERRERLLLERATRSSKRSHSTLCNLHYASVVAVPGSAAARLPWPSCGSWSPVVARWVTVAAAALVLAPTMTACGSKESVDQGPFAYDAGTPLCDIDRGVVDDDYPIAVHDISYAVRRRHRRRVPRRTTWHRSAVPLSCTSTAPAAPETR